MTDTAADRTALALLRPGATMAVVAHAYGSAWKPPLPHREGRVLMIDATDGVVTRFTANGRLGSIRFNWRFGDEMSVLGIQMSARLEAITARFPTIDLRPLVIKPFTLLHHVEGPQLHVRMELGSTHDGQRYLRRIELFDPDAVYPPKRSVAYPAPRGEPGAPFKDFNFKLAVLSELMDKGHIDIGEPQDLYDHVLGRPFDLENEGYTSVPEARDFLARYPLTSELLAKITSLELDGGNEIYRYIEYFWGGETDDFTITSFDGREALTNLADVRIISMVDDDRIDIAPLLRRGVKVR